MSTGRLFKQIGSSSASLLISLVRLEGMRVMQAAIMEVHCSLTRVPGGRACIGEAGLCSVQSVQDPSWGDRSGSSVFSAGSQALLGFGIGLVGQERGVFRGGFYGLGLEMVPLHSVVIPTYLRRRLGNVVHLCAQRKRGYGFGEQRARLSIRNDIFTVKGCDKD